MGMHACARLPCAGESAPLARAGIPPSVARRARLLFAGISQHITQRGNNWQATFFGEGNYRCCLAWLFEAATKHECRIDAYVLTTNYVHLRASAQQPYELSHCAIRPPKRGRPARSDLLNEQGEPAG